VIIQISEAKGGPKKTRKLIKQVNGNVNYVSSTDENK
jgi:hypothetical protein